MTLAIKLGLIVVFLISMAFTIYRFGLFEEREAAQSIREIIPEAPSPTTVPSVIPTRVSSPSASIKLLAPPGVATASQRLLLSWFVESPKIATISHTAVHFGKLSVPDAKFPSDYPEKSAIFKGTIPATFSAQLLLPLAGLYFFRAHAILEDEPIWSGERTITVVEATASVTPKISF